MTTATTTAFDWLRHLNKVLIQHDEIPLLGSPPPQFDWAKFSGSLTQVLEVSDLKISPTDWCWRCHAELFTGLGEPLSPVKLTLSPLNGSVWWLMNENDITQLLSWIVAKNNELLPFLENDSKEAFYRFLMLEAIHVYQQQSSSSSLSPSFSLTDETPEGEALCLDINLSFQDKSLWGRLALSPEVRKSWKEFQMRGQIGMATTAMAQDLEVLVHLEAGKTTLSFEQWSKVVPGDLLLLDTCSIDPVEEKAKVLLTVNGQPILRGRLRKGKLKILDYPHYYEVDNSMAKDVEEEEEDFDSEEEGSELDEFDEHEDEHTDEFEEEHDSETDHPAPVAAKGASPMQTAKAAGEPTEKRTSIQPGEIPLQITVEVARVKMTVQTLMNLQPGNLLELNVRPEQGVDLVVNGKKIGHGELMKLGETLGVRILEVG